jgi:hypothetical protein
MKKKRNQRMRQVRRYVYGVFACNCANVCVNHCETYAYVCTLTRIHTFTGNRKKEGSHAQGQEESRKGMLDVFVVLVRVWGRYMRECVVYMCARIFHIDFAYRIALCVKRRRQRMPDWQQRQRRLLRMQKRLRRTKRY